MTKICISLLLIFITLKLYSQKKNFIDQPYLKTVMSVDTLVQPDRIFLTIILDESDNKNKVSTEQLETRLQKTLKDLNINTQKQLQLLDFNSDFKKQFLGEQKVLKLKMYSLMVSEANMVGKVLVGLENVEISNVTIDRTAYSKSQELLMELKSRAIKKAKKQAELMTTPLNQKIGKALYISDSDDTSNLSNSLAGQVSGVRIRGGSAIYRNRASEPMLIEFNKLKFSATVQVRFALE